MIFNDMDFIEIKNKSKEELQKMLEDSRVEFKALKFKMSSGELKMAHKLRDLKKTVARILTAMNSKS